MQFFDLSKKYIISIFLTEDRTVEEEISKISQNNTSLTIKTKDGRIMFFPLDSILGWEAIPVVVH